MTELTSEITAALHEALKEAKLKSARHEEFVSAVAMHEERLQQDLASGTSSLRSAFSGFTVMVREMYQDAAGSSTALRAAHEEIMTVGFLCA